MRKLLLTFIALFAVHFAFAQQCNVSFTTSINGMQATVTNTSSWTLIPGSTPMMWVQWGDNSSSNLAYTLNSTTSHTYSNSGTYAISVWGQYWDSLNNSMICFDSSIQVITVNSPCASSISQINNGGGSYSFTANNLGGGTGMSYSWNFGDGGTGTGASVSHTYSTSGTYFVTLVATGSGCTHTSTSTVYYWNGVLNCANLVANFSVSGNGYTKSFVNTSTNVTNVPASITKNANWDFGDGGTSTSPFFTSHTYAAAGTYTVTLINKWVDSNNVNNVYCTDTSIQQVTVSAPPPQPNVISGWISWDSSITNLQQASFKVWLIVMDSALNTLTAVDSTTTSGWLAASYSFSGHPAGSYRTKAAVVNGTNGANQLVPTYHSSSAMWNSATVINHTGGSSTGKDIQMITGLWAGGPGFIGGNISLGANKGTNGGVPNILVMLQNAQGDVVRFTYTDANGDYSFGNLAAGTYSVYPEHMNYITIPASAITLASGQYNVGGVNFKHTPTHIKPIAASIQTTSSNLFQIFPNPTAGNVEIKWASDITATAAVQVLDMTGRVVLSTDAQTNGATRLNLSSLQSGVYFIKVATDKAQHTERIVVQH
jgi:PKD repeat protein